MTASLMPSARRQVRLCLSSPDVLKGDGRQDERMNVMQCYKRVRGASQHSEIMRERMGAASIEYKPTSGMKPALWITHTAATLTHMILHVRHALPISARSLSPLVCLDIRCIHSSVAESATSYRRNPAERTT